jgi:dTDP-4-dehydrorhamnose 3,5-epimerase
VKFLPAKIDGVILIVPEIFKDERGFFLETYHENLFYSNGINYKFVQDNHSGSCQGVLRGLHYQIRSPQGKIIRVIKGEIFDVAVDLRKQSPSFGNWIGYYLSEENKNQLWIPPGFAHGFYTMSNWAEISYKATDNYMPEFERTILWSDPEINIEWPIKPGVFPILSKKDSQGKCLKEAEVFE